MITAKLTRYYSGLKATLGVLKLNEEHCPIYTLELPWRENKADISCIPEGSYKVTPYSSEKFPDVYQINNVAGRDFILLHVGNTPADTHGCVLLGKAVNSLTPMVSNSQIALDLLKSLVGNSEFTLIVGNL